MFLRRASGLITGCFLRIVGHGNCGQIPDLALSQSSRMRNREPSLLMLAVFIKAMPGDKRMRLAGLALSG